MPAALSGALDYANRQHGRFVADLQSFTHFPSVSAQPARAEDVHRCASWLAGRLSRAGLQEVRIIPTPRHPAVTASWRGAPGRPTLLIYGHYDVQPAGPPDAWTYPPFEPIVRGDYLYGRGSSDDKGQVMAHIAALESLLKKAGRLPLNVICLFEGEEEIGSPNLGQVVRCLPVPHLAVISDTAIPAPDRPAITYALRGNLEMEIELTGARSELHSGVFGGAIENPAQVLVRLLSSLQSPGGRIQVPGFYDRVRRWNVEERAIMRRSGPSNEEFLRNAGVARGWGEAGFTLYERSTIRPSLSINGLTSGYQGKGGKSIIPERASAKLSLRLVPEQDPQEIRALLCEFLQARIPVTMRAHIHAGEGSRAVYLNRHNPTMHAAARAYREGFGCAPVFIRSGGSIPVVRMLVDRFGIPVVLMGFGLPDDRIHAVNERFYLPNFYNGIRTAIWFLYAAARLWAGGPALAGRHARSGDVAANGGEG